jgi:erythromycin esterase-like protein
MKRAFWPVVAAVIAAYTACTMSQSAPQYATLDEWIASDAIEFSLDSTGTFETALDRMMEACGAVELLGFGEPTHGVEDFLIWRTRLFQRLVEAHGFTAIAVESSFPRGRFVNEYVNGSSNAGGPTSFDDVQECGFSHGFGRMAANRELIEWMRAYNADPSHGPKLQYYGFDSPTEMMYTDSPRQLLMFALDYLATIDRVGAEARRERMESLLGADADWENPAANMDPTKSIGGSPAASQLRLETEDFITELRMRQPELIASGDAEAYFEAVHYAEAARQLLTYHAAVARASSTRLVELLGIRDLMMADNLQYIVERERRRSRQGSTRSPQGRVLAFAHNSHLKRGKTGWQWGPQFLAWWPAGAHMSTRMGERYSVIGCVVGESETLGLGTPEHETLEARLMNSPGPGRLVPTRLGARLSAVEIDSLPARSVKNPGYFPFTRQSVTDFDWLMIVDSIA